MWLRRGRVGQLLPQIVLAHFSASNTVQQGLGFRALKDFGLTAVVDRRVMHLVQMQHLLEEIVLLLLVMQDVDRKRWMMRRMSCRRGLGVVRLIFGNLSQQLLESIHLLLLGIVGKMARSRTSSAATTTSTAGR